MLIDTRVVTAAVLFMVKFTAIFTRAAEHMSVSNLTGKRLKNIKYSAVSHHLLQCNCSKLNLLVKDSLRIKLHSPVLNRTAKSLPLEIFD